MGAALRDLSGSRCKTERILWTRLSWSKKPRKKPAIMAGAKLLLCGAVILISAMFASAASSESEIKLPSEDWEPASEVELQPASKVKSVMDHQNSNEVDDSQFTQVSASFGRASQIAEQHMTRAGVPRLKDTTSKRPLLLGGLRQRQFAVNVLVKKEKGTKERQAKDANFKRDKERKIKWQKRAMDAIEKQKHSKLYQGRQLWHQEVDCAS